MKRFAIVVAAVVALYLAWGWAFPSGTLRYRLGFEVDVDGKKHTGSGVIEVSYRIPPSWLLPGNRVSARAKGEAIVVDIGTRGQLFVALQGEPIRESGCLLRQPGSDAAERVQSGALNWRA